MSSTVARLFSGSVAAWFRIFVIMASQILLVPIFLSAWDQETYGVWLAIAAFSSVLNLLDVGHQNYLGFEFLRLGEDRREVEILFSSALPIGILLGCGQFALVVGMVGSGTVGSLLGLSGAEGDVLIRQAGIILLAQSACWLVVGSLGGIVVRLLSSMGYYPRMAWWGVFSSLVMTVIPALAVIQGANLLTAGLAGVAGVLFYNFFLFRDVLQLLRRLNFRFIRPTWSLGGKSFYRSLALTFRLVMESGRHQGARLVLSPLVGPADMAAFATMRTGANVALQGLGTVTSPLMPELMRYLRQGDQARSEGAFSVVWLAVVMIMAPAIIILQAFAPVLFGLWTQGKIPFDPLLFAVLSVGVLVFALGQPAIAVVQGNNLLRQQLLLSAMGGGIAVGGMVILVPLLGIRGAAVALLLAEIAAAIGFVTVAIQWLRKHDLRWPTKAFASVLSSVTIATTAILVMAWFPQQKFIVLWLGLGALTFCAYAYWVFLPEVARNRAQTLIISRVSRFRKKPHS